MVSIVARRPVSFFTIRTVWMVLEKLVETERAVRVNGQNP